MSTVVEFTGVFILVLILGMFVGVGVGVLTTTKRLNQEWGDRVVDNPNAIAAIHSRVLAERAVINALIVENDLIGDPR